MKYLLELQSCHGNLISNITTLRSNDIFAAYNYEKSKKWFKRMHFRWVSIFSDIHMMSMLKISWMTYYKMDFRMRSQGQVHGWMIGRLYVTFVFEAYSFEMHLMSCKITMKFITVTSFSIFSRIFCFTIVVHLFDIIWLMI